MVGVITTNNISRLVQEGVARVYGQQNGPHPEQWSQLFNVLDSKKNFETDVQLEGFSSAVRKYEGDSIVYDSQMQGFSPKYPIYTYGKGFVVTREALEDNLYNLFSKRARALKTSILQKMEEIHADVLNNGFDSNYTMTDGDGVELFSSLHPRGPSDSSTYVNELSSPTALSEAALEDILILISQATDARGNKIALMGKELWVPPALTFEAQRILGSVLQNDTANNAINAIRSTGLLPGGWKVNNYFTSSTAYFVTTNDPSGLTSWKRREMMFEEDKEFTTENRRFQATFRQGVGWTNPRGVYGTEGA